MLKITCFGGVNEIGGNKIMLEDNGSAIMLDFGKSFGTMGKYFDEFLQPRTNSCLRDLLRLGVLPPIPGIYRKDLLTHAGVWNLIVDCGLPESARILFEYDIESCEDYVKRCGKPRIDGILLSHGHTDHCQHLCFVDPSIPIFCSPATKAILRAVEDVGRGGWESQVCSCSLKSVVKCSDKSTFPRALTIDSKENKCIRDIRSVLPFEEFSVGGFIVEPVPVDHSVPGAYAYIIKSPSGKIVFYTGDLRFHGRFSIGCNCITSRLRERTKNLCPDVLISEGTRLASEGKVTSEGDNEQDVEIKLKEAVGACSGLAVVDFGWKDTTRFQTVLNVAKATNRVLAVNPKVAYLWAKLREVDPENFPDIYQSENIKVYLERTHSMTYSIADYTEGNKYVAGLDVDWGDRNSEMKKHLKALLKDGDFDKVADEYKIYYDDELGRKIKAKREDQEGIYIAPRLCHYLNGVRAYEIALNPGKYILHAGYYDMNELFDVSPPQGSIYISASTEPFCDEMEFDERRLSNWLEYFGLKNAGDHISHYHVSGHANGSDLLDFITDVNPKIVIPVHTICADIFDREIGDRHRIVIPSPGEEINIE